MRKLNVALLAAALLMCINGFGQQSKTSTREKSFLILSGGPSFPLGDYGSSDINNTEAGLAKTGYNVNLQYAYYLTNNFGLTATALYTKHAIDNSLFSSVNASADHWQYFAFVVGAINSAPVSPKAAFDFSLMTGIARVNSPKVSSNNSEVLAERWATTVPLKADANMRFHLKNKWQFLAGLNFMYMDPKFKDQSTNDNFSQKMNILGLNAGIGFGF
jgi:hypothetical protein